LTSALVGGEWSASCSDRFIPGERVSGTDWIRGRVGPRASLDDVEKILAPPSSSPWPFAILTVLSRLLVLYIVTFFINAKESEEEWGDE
jgi:hypothetical protein